MEHAPKTYTLNALPGAYAIQGSDVSFEHAPSASSWTASGVAVTTLKFQPPQEPGFHLENTIATLPAPGVTVTASVEHHELVSVGTATATGVLVLVVGICARRAIARYVHPLREPRPPPFDVDAVGARPSLPYWAGDSGRSPDPPVASGADRRECDACRCGAD
jgi:hypothetical protein